MYSHGTCATAVNEVKHSPVFIPQVWALKWKLQKATRNCRGFSANWVTSASSSIWCCKNEAAQDNQWSLWPGGCSGISSAEENEHHLQGTGTCGLQTAWMFLPISTLQEQKKKHLKKTQFKALWSGLILDTDTRLINIPPNLNKTRPLESSYQGEGKCTLQGRM